MERQTLGRKVLTGLVALAATVSPVFGDIGGSTGYRREYKKVEDAAAVVKVVEDVSVQDSILYQLYDRGLIKDSDPILPRVLGILESRKHYKAASKLAKKLGQGERAKVDFVEYSRVKTEEWLRMDVWPENYTNLAKEATEFGLDFTSKRLCETAVDKYEERREFVRAGNVAKNNLGDIKRAMKLYTKAIEIAEKTPTREDDVWVYESMGELGKAYDALGEVVKAEAEKCDFDDAGHYSYKRADIAKKLGREEDAKRLEQEAAKYYVLDGYDVNCGKK